MSQKTGKFDSAAAHANILETGRFADFEVECQSHIWKLHRSILFGKSEFFNHALDGNFKERDDGKMHFPVDDPAVMARLIIFFYTSDFPRANPEARDNVIYKGQFAKLVDPFESCDLLDELNLCIKMYCIADKYLAPPLKEAALRYYCDSLNKFAEHLEDAQEHVSGTIFGSKLIPLVYEADTLEEDRDLKDPLLILILLNLEATKHVNRHEHAKMVAGAPSEFMFDLLMRPLKGMLWHCEKCDSDTNVLDGYCVCGKLDCDKTLCWTEDMTNVQCRECGGRGFMHDQYRADGW